MDGPEVPEEQAKLAERIYEARTEVVRLAKTTFTYFNMRNPMDGSTGNADPSAEDIGEGLASVFQAYREGAREISLSQHFQDAYGETPDITKRLEVVEGFMGWLEALLVSVVQKTSNHQITVNQALWILS
ncbi:hypothetical protein ACFL1B_04210 [Nanoarchaeota archaeon]